MNADEFLRSLSSLLKLMRSISRQLFQFNFKITNFPSKISKHGRHYYTQNSSLYCHKKFLKNKKTMFKSIDIIFFIHWGINLGWTSV